MSSAVLMLHSTGTMPSMWRPYADTVAPLGEVLTPAHRGYPPHAPVARGVTISARDDAEAVVAQIPPRITDVHVVAHSYGGVVALALLPLLQIRVRSLLLFEPVLFATLRAAPDGDVAARAELDAMLADPQFIHDEQAGGSDAWIERFLEFWNRPGAWQRLPPEQQRAMRAIGWKMFQEVRNVSLDDVFDAAQAQRLVSERVPITLAYGMRSPHVARAVVELLARCLPHSQVVALADSGHMAPLAQSALVDDALRAHVQRVLGGDTESRP
jgi:pimeloyl-ACP methyl ester carboxylesterase